MKTCYLALASLLAGCGVYTPQQILDQGYRTSHSSPRDVLALTRCITSNAEEARYIPTQRPLDSGGNIELVIRWIDQEHLAMGRIEKTATGSRATLWIRPDPPFRSQQETAAVLLKGC